VKELRRGVKGALTESRVEDRLNESSDRPRPRSEDAVSEFLESGVLEEKDDSGGKEVVAVIPLEYDSGSSGSAETETVESFDLVVVVVVMVVVMLGDRDVPVDVAAKADPAVFSRDDSVLVVEPTTTPPVAPDDATEASPSAPVSVAVVAMVVEVEEPVEIAVMGGSSNRSMETAAIACLRSCTVTVEPFRLWVR